MARQGIKSFYVPNDKQQSYTKFLNIIDILKQDKRFKNISPSTKIVELIEAFVQQYEKQNGRLVLTEQAKEIQPQANM